MSIFDMVPSKALSGGFVYFVWIKRAQVLRSRQQSVVGNMHLLQLLA